MNLEKYEDTIRSKKENQKEQFSSFCDFRFVKSTITPGVTFAIRVLKPASPSYIKAGTHGWHMSIFNFQNYDEPQSDYLEVEVDMRGRAFSTGKPDCNGYELYDIYDAINFVKKEYRQYIISDEVMYFESGSGGGGNALAIAGKFPDLFSAINAFTPISDYYEWYKFDEKVGEFRDEMDIWISPSPDENRTAYDSRSGITMIENLLTSLFICHGTSDERVPYFLSEMYLKRAAELKKGDKVKLHTLHNVGTQDHYGNITKEQMSAFLKSARDNLDMNRTPIAIPKKGSFVVCGYLVTKAFSVFLSSIDVVTVVHYDTKSKTAFLDNMEIEHKIIWHN